jgi:hypothetical protein
MKRKASKKKVAELLAELKALRNLHVYDATPESTARMAEWCDLQELIITKRAAGESAATERLEAIRLQHLMLQDLQDEPDFDDLREKVIEDASRAGLAARRQTEREPRK